jgi:hypothetical protein
LFTSIDWSHVPESYEKRQRSRRKQQKRKEKQARRLQRKAEKARGPLHHTLHRKGEEHTFETDLWLAVLDLVAVAGWSPPEPEAFAHPAGLELSAEDAADLASSIDSLLPTISDEELPLSDYPSGVLHTESVLARRAAGEKLELEDSAAAQELLSGPVKGEVERLMTFLKGGSATILAETA